MRHWVTRFSLVACRFPSALLAAYRLAPCADRCSSTSTGHRDSNHAGPCKNLVKARDTDSIVERCFGVCFQQLDWKLESFDVRFSEASSEPGYLSKITYSALFVSRNVASSFRSQEYRFFFGIILYQENQC